MQRDEFNIRDFGALGNGTDDTNAVRVAIGRAEAVRGTVIVPKGAFSHGPVRIKAPITVRFSSGATVVPLFDPSVPERLYDILSSGVTMDGVSVKGVHGIVRANKYLIVVSGGARGVVIRRSRISDVTMSDGITGHGNLLVCHALYADDAADLEVHDNQIDGVSGAAIFLNAVRNARVLNNHISSTRWYSIHAESDCHDVQIRSNTIDGTDPLARWWGGSIDLRSQIGAPANSRFTVANNTISGAHNYGAAIRLESLHDSTVSDNHVFGCIPGKIAPGAGVQYIGVDRRGTAEGAPQNGACRGLRIQSNKLVAAGSANQGIYIKNLYMPLRDPHVDIEVSGNTMQSPTQADYFAEAISIHGGKSGLEQVRVRNNIATVRTGLGSPIGGALGLTAFTPSGSIDDCDIARNELTDIGPRTNRDPKRIGMFFLTNVGQNIRASGNRLTNFYCGARVAEGVRVAGLRDQVFVDNTVNVVEDGQPK